MPDPKVPIDDRVFRQFALAALAWGVLALAAGLMVAAGLLRWSAGSPAGLEAYRLVPAHAYVATYALIGNLVFAGVYGSSQRLLDADPPPSRLAAVHLWGWQLAMVLAASSLVWGAVGEGGAAAVAWPIDALKAAVWLVFGWNLAAMVRRRRNRRLYVSIWFYLASAVGVAAVLLVGALVVPVGLTESYPVAGGAAAAFVEAWGRSGLESFLLIAPLFGLAYHLVPAAAGRPLFSHRLAVFHFWSFLFVASWLAPRGLLTAPVPEWLSAIGPSVSLLVWIPALAGAINLLATMRGAGSRVLGDPALKFAAAALVCMGAWAIEVALSGAGGVSLTTGYTDWSQGRAHLLTMGWAGFLSAALLYWLAPASFGAPLGSKVAAGAHLYVAVVGLALYAGATWLAGATQGAMLHSQDAAGGLRYEFFETVSALEIPYALRLAGGSLYALGFAIMIVNLALTWRAGRMGHVGAIPEDATRAAGDRAAERPCAWALIFGAPVIVAALTIALLAVAVMADVVAGAATLLLAFVVALGGYVAIALSARGGQSFHDRLERRGLALTALVAAAALHGPLLQGGALALSAPDASTTAPYSALELEGRDIYRREACASCHTQMIRPLLSEVARYGEVLPEGAPHDRPTLWGDRRVGPDLARIGERAELDELVRRLRGDHVPSLAHLEARTIEAGSLALKLRAQAALGVPYEPEDIAAAAESARTQGAELAERLAAELEVEIDGASEMVALLAYLQRLGRADDEEAP